MSSFACQICIYIYHDSINMLGNQMHKFLIMVICLHNYLMSEYDHNLSTCKVGVQFAFCMCSCAPKWLKIKPTYEQFELNLIWKSCQSFQYQQFFSLPRRHHCQNSLFMQTSKRNRKNKTTPKIKLKYTKSGMELQLLPVFLSFCQKCLSLIRLSYLKACPVVVICLWYRAALWSWMLIFIETLLSFLG